MGRKGTDLTQAAEYIDQILKRDRHLEKVAEALKRLGSLEGAESETQERLEGLRAQIAEAEAELAQARSDEQDAREEAQRLLDNASAEADEIVRQAQSQATAEEKRLRQDFDRRLEDMQEQEAEATRRAQEIVADAQAEAHTWHQEANTKAAQVEQAQTVLAELEDKITRAREAAKRLLGD